MSKPLQTNPTARWQYVADYIVCDRCGTIRPKAELTYEDHDDVGLVVCKDKAWCDREVKYRAELKKRRAKR